MSCCQLAIVVKKVAGKRKAYCKKCKPLQQVHIRVYGISGGCAENTQYKCNKCGFKKTGRGRPDAMRWYIVESDWRKRK